MMHRALVITSLIAVLIVGTAWLSVQGQSSPQTAVRQTSTQTQFTTSQTPVTIAAQPQQASTPAPALPTTPSSQTKTYSIAQVATHASESSCWTAINGKVYDVTEWINQHPGGSGTILSLCGTDGSDAFNAQHGGQRRPASELTNFYIGDLSS